MVDMQYAVGTGTNSDQIGSYLPYYIVRLQPDLDRSLLKASPLDHFELSLAKMSWKGTADTQYLILHTLLSINNERSKFC